jgi:hypothetical protein
MTKKKSYRKKRQKLYRMKGCSKTCKKYGGSANINLAYPSNNVPSVPNPFLAYTGKGGALENINGADKTNPNTGPPSIGYNFLNSQVIRGGCGSGSCDGMKGGGCGPLCAVAGSSGMIGGNSLNAQVGNPWTPSSSGWPGVSGVQGDNNYFPVNEYKNDISRQMIATGANPPFSVGGRRRKTKKSRGKTQKGGTLSNFLTQDLINLGRQFQFGVGSAYNTLAGYSSPVSPLPWKDQYSNSSIKSASL